MTELFLRNRQHLRAVNSPLLRQIARHIIKNLLPSAQFEIGVYLVRASDMARLNETFLKHHGSTDVITFQYHPSTAAQSIHGEIFISIDDAVTQAKQFRTSWTAEVVRYLVHGLLHLTGFDDTTPAARKAMKREENKWVGKLSRRYSFSDLEGKTVKRPAQ